MEEPVEEGDLKEEGEDAKLKLLIDRFRLSVISIAESEAKKNGLEISETVVSCISNLAYKYSEQLAKDLELFARHANRKSVNMDDVTLTAHKNEHLAGLLTNFAEELKEKEPQSERKRKKSDKRKEQEI